jgi:SAM-dependent methyltransferase
VTFAPELAENNEGFSPESFAHLARVEAGNFWFRARNRLILWALRRYFPHARSFLEIGCGTGFVLSAVVREPGLKRFNGSDIYTEALPYAQRRLPGVELFQMDARRIPFDGEFDVIGAFDVLEHIDRDDVALAEMFRACRSGGGILVTVPQHPRLWSPVDEFSHHQRRYVRKELTRKAEHAGFDVLRVTSFVSLLLPLMFAARARRKQIGRVERPTSEMELPSAVNWVMERVLDVERGLIVTGASLPAGGSLLLVGAKP